MRNYFCRRLIFWLMLIFVTGCAQSIVKLDNKAELTSDPTRSERVSYFVGGLFPANVSFETAELCQKPQNLAQTSFYYSATDVLLTLVTLNLYSPKTLNIWCI